MALPVKTHYEFPPGWAVLGRQTAFQPTYLAFIMHTHVQAVFKISKVNTFQIFIV